MVGGTGNIKNCLFWCVCMMDRFYFCIGVGYPFFLVRNNLSIMCLYVCFICKEKYVLAINELYLTTPRLLHRFLIPGRNYFLCVFQLKPFVWKCFHSCSLWLFLVNECFHFFLSFLLSFFLSFSGRIHWRRVVRRRNFRRSNAEAFWSSWQSEFPEASGLQDEESEGNQVKW